MNDKITATEIEFYKNNENEEYYDKKINIINTIKNEYKRAIIDKYNSFINQIEFLQESYELATSTFKQFNKAVASKGLKAKIEYSYDSKLGQPIAIAITFNDLFGIPLKDEYEDYIDCNRFRLNPVKNIQKMKLLLTIRTMTKNEWELLSVGIRELEDNNPLLVKINNLTQEAYDYSNKFLKSMDDIDYDIDYDILKKVVYRLYNEGIITDEFLFATIDEKKINNCERIITIKDILDELINYLECNMLEESFILCINSITEKSVSIYKREYTIDFS